MAAASIIRKMELIPTASIFIALVALIVSLYSFSYQYLDHINTGIIVTGYAIHQKMRNNTAQDKIVSQTVSDITGGLFLTIFNSGNRMVSINTIDVYLQPGDYDTLEGLSYTPPCVRKQGSKPLLSGSTGSGMFSDLRVVDAQHIIGVPLEFPIFNSFDPEMATAQGIVCLQISGYDYNGTSATKEFSVGIMKAARGTTPAPVGVWFGQLKDQKLSSVRRLF